jgi:hypothetical protein
VLSDYREFYEDGTWVPYAFHADPWAPNVFKSESHSSWVKLSTVGTGNGGFADFVLSDVHPKNHGASLTAAITRESWRNEVTTIYFDDPTATSFDYQFLESGGPSGDRVLWQQGSVPATHTWNINASSATINMGGWAWYDAKVRACAGGTCGDWTSRRSVSFPPFVYLDSLSWASGVITAQVHADPAPAETTFSYRVLDVSPSSGNSHMAPMKVGRVTGTPARFSSSATIRFGNGGISVWGLLIKFQVQACSQNGCSAWAESTIYTQ